jgi:hypothetical protein
MPDLRLNSLQRSATGHTRMLTSYPLGLHKVSKTSTVVSGWTKRPSAGSLIFLY